MRRTTILLLTLAAVGGTLVSPVLATPVSADVEEQRLVGTWRGETHDTQGRYRVEQTFRADGTMRTLMDYASGLQVEVTGRWKMLSPRGYRQYNDNWSPKEWQDGPLRVEIHFPRTERHRFRFHGSRRIRIDGRLTLHRVR